MNTNTALETEMENENDTNIQDVFWLRDTSPEKQRWDNLRRVSNVIQALENLIVQCDDVAQFSHLQEFAKSAVKHAHHKMRELVHSA